MKVRMKAARFMRKIRKTAKRALALIVLPARVFSFLWKRKVIQRGVAATLVVLCVDVGSYLFRPDVSELRKQNPRLTELMVFMERRSQKGGDGLDISQEWVPLQNISPYLVKAVLIAEDDKFWSHDGFDVEAIKTAIERDIREKRFKFGGSTITQQLAKNLYLSPSKNPVRKLREAVITWRMERALSKSRILEIYLNVAEWGDGIYGIEAAARHYYGKPARDLGPMESARLASALPNPKRYRPTGPSRYVENRSEIIYKEMVRRGIVEVQGPPPESSP